MGVLRPILDWLEEQDWGWFNFIRDQLIGIVSWIDGIISPFFDRAEKFIDKLWELDLRIFSFIIDTLEKLKKGFDEIWNNLVYLAVDVIHRIRVLVDELYWSIYYAIKYTVPYLADTVVQLSDRLRDLAEKAITDIGELWEDLKSKVKELIDDSFGLLYVMVSEVKNDVMTLSSNLVEISNSLRSFVKDTLDSFKKEISVTLNNFSTLINDKIIPSISNLYDLFWGWINDLELAWQLFKERRKAKPKMVPTVHVNLTKETYGKMGIGRRILEGLLEIVIEIIIWIIASFAVDVVIDWLYGDYDLEKGELTGIPIEMMGFLEWVADLSTGKLEIKTPIATGPLIPVIMFERGGR